MHAGLFGAFAVALVAGALPVLADGACPADRPGVAMISQDKTELMVMLAVQPPRIEVSSPFQVTIAPCAASGITINRVSVDATMPLHRHGMNYQPAVEKTDGGSYTATGLLFHMPELWRIEVGITADGKTQRFFHDIEIK